MSYRFDGGRMRSLRRAAGLKAEALAVYSRRSLTTVLDYETGATTPPVDVAADIAAALGVSITDLLVEAAADVA